jgi:hypothetical protein
MCSVVNNLGSASNDSNDISSPQATLPADFRSWKKVYWAREGFGWQWELLRTFFANKGYVLYVYRDPLKGLNPEIENDPPDDSFGLLGVRTNFWPLPLFWCHVRIILLHIHFKSYFINLQRGEVWGARDMSVF